MPEDLNEALAKVQRMALGIGVIGALICIIGLFVDRSQFFRSYLFSWLFWFGIALGSLALQMLQFLTGGRWGVVSERIFEASARTLPALAVLFLVIAAGIPSLYPWSHSDVVANDPVLRHKAAYLNVPFFLIRAVVFFVIWSGAAYLLSRWSGDQYERRPYVLTRRLSAVGLIVYVFSVTFAAIDWAESIQPHAYSTMWGFIFVAEQALGAMAFTILTACLLVRWPAFSEAFSVNRLHELGNLLLAFVMLWAYFSFSQFLIIWTGNTTEEIPFYLERMFTSWGWISVALVLLQFFVPFLLLLSRDVKRNSGRMIALTGLVLFARLVETYWITIPGWFPSGFHVHWLDLAAPVAIGGLWVSMFAMQLRSRPLLPERDPRLTEVLGHAA